MDTQTFRSIINYSLSISDVSESLDSLEERFFGEYLPALNLAVTTGSKDRVWLAFWNYLTSRPTLRKPFTFSPNEADRIIILLQSYLSKETGQ